MKYAPLVLVAVFATTLSADTLTLRDGTVIHGHFVSGTPQKIIFQDHNGVWRRFEVKQVQGIDFQGDAAPGQASQGGAEGTAERAGSFIEVRTEEAIAPTDAAPGRTFLATIVGDIQGANGTVVIPAGSPARLMLRPSGADAQAGFEVLLESVVIAGSRYVVYGQATAVSQKSADAGAAPETEAASAVVSGPTINVPQDTVLEFRLEQPLLLRQAGE